mmetsp:Transcript_14706/g.29508  ORF Transcript_14706/g.29508 Transcript_14706/m.29508 type:complete len:90 (+) Transcript_14706:456-725(+)
MLAVLPPLAPLDFKGSPPSSHTGLRHHLAEVPRFIAPTNMPGFIAGSTAITWHHQHHQSSIETASKPAWSRAQRENALMVADLLLLPAA